MASITPTDILTKPLFNWSDVAEMRQPAVKAEKDRIVKEAKDLRENAKTPEEKIAATQADKAAAKSRKEIEARRFADAHLWTGVPTLQQADVENKLHGPEGYRRILQEERAPHRQVLLQDSQGQVQLGHVCAARLEVREVCGG